MPTWEVTLEFRKTLIVRGAVYADALQNAESVGEILAADLGPGAHVGHVQVLKQMGEPWVTGGQWYCDRDERPSDVIVFERSLGNYFTKKDIELLHCRITAQGLCVTSSWNGEGCTSVSFKVSGRNGTELIPRNVRQALCAPRPAASEHA
jgi:hypothetical protein